MTEAPRVLVYSPGEAPLFELDASQLIGLVRTEEINGEHSITVTTTERLQKACRLLFQDGMGKWREYVVRGVDEDHLSSRKPIGTYYAVWSLQDDLMGVCLTRAPFANAAASTALGYIVENTARWSVGTVTQTSTASGSFYYKSGWEAVSELVKGWGGEVDATIQVDGNGIVARKVDLYAHQGSSTAVRRFDYGRDVSGIRRKEDEAKVTPRILPRGKGEETEGGGYGRRIGIEDANGGIPWLEDSESAAVYRLPNGSGGWEYPIQVIVNEDMDTPQKLKDWALSVMEEYTRPKVTYEADVVQLAKAGMDAHGVGLGDVSQVVDRSFGEDGLRISGRVVKLVVDELDPSNTAVTLGYLNEGFAGMLGGFAGKLDSLSNGLWDVAYQLGCMSTAQYVSELLERLNAEINATGGYTYITEGYGIRTYDRAVEDPTSGLEASKVVEVKGGSIRIADSKTAQGDWDWDTVFVSGHIAAALVTAVAITAGFIGSASGGNYWNLDTGELRIAGTATVAVEEGGATTTHTLADVIDAAEATITDVDVEYADSTSSSTAPSTGWSTVAPSWQAGHYIWQRTATTVGYGSSAATAYSQPTCISGRDGQDGQDGQTGIGVSAVVEQYYLSTSSSAQAGGQWSTAQPAWASGKYIWTRSHITWTDGTTTDTDPVLAQAINGANEAVATLDSALDQQGVFNRLTNNGQTQGIYLSNGKVYINASYISSGALSASLITTGSMSAARITSGTMSANRISGGSISASDVAITNLNASNITTGSLTVGQLLSVNVGAGTVTIAGFTVTATTLYSGKSTLNSVTAGVFIGHLGISVGNGDEYVAIGYGGLYGHSNATQISQGRYAGYITFGQYLSTYSDYGMRVAAHGGIVLMTDGTLYVGPYATYNTSMSSAGTYYRGMSGSMTINGKTIWFWKGLMVTDISS